MFPKDFLWGVATSAFQIEGSPLADGAGASNWYRFTQEPGRVFGGDTADVACDHYRRMANDVRLMASLGIKAYRFSIAWPRVFPEGRGRLNQAGIDFYRRLVDHLADSGIVPMVTLFHWDLPWALQEQGGWTVRDSAGWFSDYADAMFRTLGGTVPYWVTLNEPWVVVDGGYVHGVHPPGVKSLRSAAHAAHNLLRAHALAVQAFRSDGQGQIGLVVNLEPKYPSGDDAETHDAVRRAHHYMNQWYLDPVMRGCYPEAMPEIFGEDWPDYQEGDLRLIQEPIDFLGINYYTRSVVRSEPTAWPLRSTPVRQASAAYTELDWEVYADGLADTLRWVRGRYGNPPVYITENGAAFADPAIDNGRVRDQHRIDYLAAHLRALHAALEEGVDLRGYFVWSLLDNFEWTWGFSKRFGLVQVDYETQARTPKDSAYFYQRVIESNGASVLQN